MCERGRRMHASKDSCAGLRWAALGGSAVVLCLCLSVFPSIYPSVYFLSSLAGAGGYFATLSSRLVSSPPLPSPVLHCTALYLSPPPFLIPLTPRHIMAKEVPYYYVCNTTGTSSVAAACTCTCTHTHTHADVQCSPTQHGSTGIRKGVGVGVGRCVGRGRGVGTAGVCEALIYNV
jgi:hypothetical protein